MFDFENNLRSVHQHIGNAAVRAGRDPKEITLIAVSKTFPAEAIIAAHELGVRNFGENRVEEAINKILIVQSQLANDPTNKPIWHMVGHLQSRKVKDAVSLFDFVHSIDSVELAKRIEKHAAATNKTISVLLEVNISGEASKYGFALSKREDFFAAVQNVLTFKHLNVLGLMSIAPIVQQPEDARPYFRALRELRDELQVRHLDHPFPHLSMGMTDDFEAAVAEGATMLRIGRAIFGDRK